MKHKVKSQAKDIFSKIFFEEITAKELISWFEYAYDSGYKSAKLEQVLSTKEATESDLIKSFFAILKELKIKISKSSEKVFKKHSLSIAIQYLERKIAPEVALKKILLVTQNSEFKDDYYPFVEYCLKHDFILKNLELQRTHLMSKGTLKVELDSIFLAFAEEHHELKLRRHLKKKPINHIIYDRRHNSSIYDRLSLLIIDDLISKSGLNKEQIKVISITKKR